MRFPRATYIVVVCKTRKNALHAHKLIQAIMERLEVTLHPEKTRIVGLWTMARLDWYIRTRLTKWYAKKRQRNRWHGSGYDVKRISQNTWT